MCGNEKQPFFVFRENRILRVTFRGWPLTSGGVVILVKRIAWKPSHDPLAALPFETAANPRRSFRTLPLPLSAVPLDFLDGFA